MASKKRQLPRATDRGSDKFIIRLPEGMRQHLAELAKQHGRSMNAEVVTALAVYFAELTLGRPVPPERVPDVYELLFKIGNTVEHLVKEVEKLNKKVGKT